MTTAATIHTADSAHWYTTKGEPCYELPKKDGKGMKKPTLADARKLMLLPSVTTILRILDKRALNDWKVTQGVLAVLTTPRQPGETDDAFVHRVLQVERVQDQESTVAKDKGTEIHAALEAYFIGQEVNPEIRPWIEPAARAIGEHGQVVCAEKILVGNGYAGKTDFIQENTEHFLVWDFKTTKTLPTKGAWPEHELQLAAYAAAFSTMMVPVSKPIRTLNCYISTIDQGKFVIWPNAENWGLTYNNGFAPLVTVWQFLNGYKPQQ